MNGIKICSINDLIYHIQYSMVPAKGDGLLIFSVHNLNKIGFEILDKTNKSKMLPLA